MIEHMSSTSTIEVLDRVLHPVTESLTPESAARLATIQADPVTQARGDELADRNSEGLLTPEERAEYEFYVRFFDFLAVLRARARALLGRDGNGR